MSERLSEILGALSLTTDLADGQPSGAAMGASAIAARLGTTRSLNTQEQAEVYYATLCRFIGCTATASKLAPIALGEEQSLSHCGTIGNPADPEDFRSNLNTYFASNQPQDARQNVIDFCVEAGPRLYKYA